MEIIVKNCKNCPFCETEKDIFSNKNYSNCLHPGYKENYNVSSYWKNYKSPKWCPLKQQDLIIKFKKWNKI